MTPNEVDVDTVVEEIAAQSSDWFRASYVARRAGVDTELAYRRLNELVDRGDLDVHFELISPHTGHTLATYRVGDKVPVEQRIEPDDDRESPFKVRDQDIWISFAATQRLRQQLQRDSDLKKKVRRRFRKIRSETERIRSAVRRAHTTSKTA